MLATQFKNTPFSRVEDYLSVRTATWTNLGIKGYNLTTPINSVDKGSGF